MNTRLVLLYASAAALLLASTPCLAADRAPEREVRGTTITSQRDPALTITLPATARYLGADRWDLYGICDAELHVFVEADARKRVQRLYWVQFEQYLPDNTHTYEYPFTEKLTHAGLTFDVKAVHGPSGSPVRPGSDSEHMRAMLAKAGYSMPPMSMNLRLVHVLNEARRKELMFIYAEELPGPVGENQWPDVKAQLIQGALHRIQISNRGSSPD